MSFCFSGRSWYGFILQDVIFFVKFILCIFVVALISNLCAEEFGISYCHMLLPFFFSSTTAFYCRLCEVTKAFKLKVVYVFCTYFGLSSILVHLRCCFFFFSFLSSSSHTCRLSFLTMKRETMSIF